MHLRRCIPVSCQMSAVPDLYCILTMRLIESIGGIFDPVVSSAMAVFEHVKGESGTIILQGMGHYSCENCCHLRTLSPAQH